MPSIEDAANDHQTILAMIERLSVLLYDRNPEIVSELWSSGFRLVGSEIGEIVETHEGLVALIDNLFSRAPRFSWDWMRKDISIHKDFAWAFAEGHLVQTSIESVKRTPYRLAAIFQKDSTGWKWRLFSGSEPV